MIEHKKIANYLPTGAILFFIIIALAYLLMPEPEKKFELSHEEALTSILNDMQVIEPDKVKEIIATNDQSYQFIDLRTPKEFNLHHIPGAINIHVHDILKKEYEPILNQTEKVNIFYGANVEDACPTLIILKQLGYKNNANLLGGYNLIKSNIIDIYAPDDVWFKNEDAQYDYAKIVKPTVKTESK